MDAHLEVTCAACSWRMDCGPRQVERLVRQAGMLKREAETDRAVLRELLHAAAPRLNCPECGTPGLRVVARPADEGDWQDAVTCEICRQPIPSERLEALPGATRCVGCQHDEETGQLADEPEYCPRCGAPLVLKVSRGRGTTRYKLFCTGVPACRL